MQSNNKSKLMLSASSACYMHWVDDSALLWTTQAPYHGSRLWWNMLSSIKYPYGNGMSDSSVMLWNTEHIFWCAARPTRRLHGVIAICMLEVCQHAPGVMLCELKVWTVCICRSTDLSPYLSSIVTRTTSNCCSWLHMINTSGHWQHRVRRLQACLGMLASLGIQCHAV